MDMLKGIYDGIWLQEFGVEVAQKMARGESHSYLCFDYVEPFRLWVVIESYVEPRKCKHHVSHENIGAL